MDWKEFVAWFVKNGGKPGKDIEREYDYKLHKGYDLKFCKLSKYSAGVVLGNLYSKVWCSGGRSGGSCWDEGDSTYHSVDSDEPIKDWLLHTFLEENYPNITFLQYRRVEAIFGYEDSEENEYYGNYTNYRRYKIKLKDLYEVLEGKPAPSTPKQVKKKASKK